MGKFTIGFVNYKTSGYMDTQLKIYKNFAGEDFNIVVLDNTQDKTELENLKNIFDKHEIPLTLIVNKPKSMWGSAQHGSGLQKIYKTVETDYFITQDPDFFWVRPYFLTFIKEKLKKNVAVGAPYMNPQISSWNGPADFPSAFGCAYSMKELKKIDADFTYVDPQVSRAPNNIIKDVGHKIRGKLRNRPYFSFKPRFHKTNIKNASFGLTYGCHSYLHKNDIFAFHILRGSFEAPSHLKISSQERLKKEIPEDWVNARKEYCDFFWKTIQEAKS